ncbi:probable E3 ubiquitin-protein ligase XBOS34 [Papaver somniferum]|uniref:probable E3 ubiquitin-protein ligase XBOS34 n=1 Tax=Papaver somniferum TaxID=3469 RepID=UPI000E6FF90F|nr:probable E3 ubiquitin-protein ligase XBOS34 [Papaver somniferum]
MQDAHPREVISLWEAKIEEPNFHHTDPSLVIVRKSSKHKVFSASDGDKQLLRWFFSACKGIPQEIDFPQPYSHTIPVPPTNAPPFTSEYEDIELAMALSASSQYTVEEARPQCPDTQISSGGSTSIIYQSSVFEAGSSSSNPSESSQPSIVSTSITLAIQSPQSIPEGTEDDQMNSLPKPAKTGLASNDVGGTSTTSCIICYDAPREGACIPCGHMVGCVSCLKEIKANNWGCPVCRNKIDGVIKIYGV